MRNNQFGKDKGSGWKMKNDGDIRSLACTKSIEDDHDHKFYNIFYSH